MNPFIETYDSYIPSGYGYREYLKTIVDDSCLKSDYCDDAFWDRIQKEYSDIINGRFDREAKEVEAVAIAQMKREKAVSEARDCGFGGF